MRILLALFLSASSLFAQADYSTLLLLQSGPSCSTASDSELENHITGASLGAYSGTAWASQQFTLSGGGTITGCFITVRDNSSDVGDTVVSIYTDNGSNDKPGSEISNTTVTVPMSSIPGSQTSVWFELPQVFTAAAATKYHIVVRGANSGVGFIYFSTSVLYTGGTATDSSNSGSTWSAANTAYDYSFSIWGCP